MKGTVSRRPITATERQTARPVCLLSVESEMTDIYRFADVNVRIVSVYQRIHSVCSSYAARGSAAFSVETGPADIAHERSLADRPGYSDDYLESLAVCRKIAERMPEYDVFLFHGSAVAADGNAYVFTAPSGTGKSTHARLWRELLGEKAVMVNDDKPFIRVRPDGTATAYGTPWDGKHHLSSNTAVPLKAVCVLERAEENFIRKISKTEALPALIRQTYRPEDPRALDRTLTLLERMNVKLYRLGCNTDLSAAELSYNTMKED